MKFEKYINVIDNYDVIVVGSGPAGIAAAVNAGKNGVKTLIIESQGRLGGIATAGYMSHWTGTVGNQTYWEILKRHNEKCGESERNTKIDPDLLTITYIEMLEEANVDCLLYTNVFDVIMEENRSVGVVCCNKTGISAYQSKIVIDASGDGDAACKSGAEYFMGRETDGKMQPTTLMFKVGGVDMERAVFPGSFETLVPTEKGELQALAKQILPAPAGHVLLYKTTIPGIVTCNMTNATGIDGTKAEDLTKAELICRKQMLPIVNFLREYVPGYENCYIVGSASLIGVRETRHFKGVQTITEQDIMQAKQFDDAVVYGAHFNFDVHNITGAGLDKTGVQKHFKQMKGYTIPYGCLVPEKVDGLLLSGRNISGTHIAHSNFRAMPICAGIGEAAGIAAALAVKGNKPVREITAREIQAIIGYRS